MPDLGHSLLLCRSQGKAPHAVPLYMTALAIYEKTLGPDHPEVAKDLVNLGNAFCDQNQHAEAVPLYLRALAIDQVPPPPRSPRISPDLPRSPPSHTISHLLTLRACRHRAGRPWRRPSGGGDGPLKSRYRLPGTGSA